MKLNHLLKALCIALVLAFGGSLANGDPQASPTPSPIPRDWVQHPAVVEVDKFNQLIAIGDAHADPEALLGLLTQLVWATRSDVQPTDLKWLAGDSVLVVTGDMIDKGPDSLRVIALLRGLQKSALDSFGNVIILMGNHEAEFLANPNGTKTDEFKRELEAKVRELKAQGKAQEAEAFVPMNVANCQGDLGEFLCNLPIAAKVGDWFFSHAGNTNGKSIVELSAVIQDAFATRQSLLAFATDKNSILDARLNKQGCGDKPWVYDCGRQTDAQVVLSRNAQALGVKHIVQGHQPGEVKFRDGVTRAENAVFQRYDGLLFLIDTGMSRGVSGGRSTGGRLSILNNVATVSLEKPDGTFEHSAVGFQTAKVICTNRTEQTLWDSRKTINTAAQHCP